MQLENSFTVPVPIDEAWRVLMDIERIAPCMPGASLDSVTGDDFTGKVKVKLGPINLTYAGKASFIEKDEAAHKAVIDARAKDQRGNGTAAAVVTAKLKEEGAVTRVDVLTDLNITGRPAQFGRGVMTDVGNKLLGQFADKLASQLGAGDQEVAAPVPAETATQKVAATATGAVEEVAASVEQVPGDGAAAAKTRTTAAAAKEAAAGATDTVSTTTPAGPAATPVSTPAAPGTPAPAPVPAATATTPAGPAATPASTSARPAAAESEPIDLLEVAGGAALARYATPLAGAAAVLLVITLIVRRRRRR
ncbi:MULTISPECIES: SRPBCC family protein [unclassified Geodermatophilus]|uniref:SRPBCC family protein n=1 Tax=unclassified Geodermatophilus TaxID=2637632 RepID=UPI003EEF1F1C